MKGSPVLTILAAALLLVGIGTASLGVYYARSLTLVFESSVEMNVAQRKEMIGQSLVTKCLEFRQKNPKIEAVLKNAGVQHPALSNMTTNPRPAGR